MDEFIKIRLLGRGACGSVSLVKSKKTQRSYAMKEIQLDPKRRTRTKEYVTKEINIMSELSHPHIVFYVSSFFTENDQRLYIIQDFCDGGTLQDKIDHAKELSSYIDEESIMRWLVQLLMGLQYIHSKYILHRDIKAANIMLTRRDIIKIGDFGIAMTLDNTLDLAQTCIGTPCYLSPEVCRSQPYGAKSDMWAVGCLLYELCALQFAFDARNIITLFHNIVKGEYKPIPDHFSSDIKKIISSLLLQNSTERPSSKQLLSNTFIKSHLETFIRDVQLPARKSPHGKSKIKLDSSSESNDMQSAKETGNYDDDFVDECESDYSDDFESGSENDDEDDDNEGVPFENNSLRLPPLNRKSKSGSSVVRSAFNALSLKNQNYTDASDDSGFYHDDPQLQESNQYYIKNRCIDRLGKDVYKRVAQVCSDHKADDFESLKSEFTQIAGSQALETCYLVNELLVEKH